MKRTILLFVLVALLLFQRTVDICESTVVVGVVFGTERMPEAGFASVFLGRTSGDENGHHSHHHQNDMSAVSFH